MSYLECAESQLAEIELLTSMFPTQEELELIDQLALAELRNYVDGSASADNPPPSRPQFLIKQKLNSASMNEVTGGWSIIVSGNIIIVLFFILSLLILVSHSDGDYSVLCLSI